MKATQKAKTEFVKNKLSTNSKWALHALMKIFDRQTEDEQRTNSTHLHNNIGFTGCDAEILSSFAKQYQRKGFLSDKQMKLLYRKISKYHRQVIELSDAKKLETMVLQTNKG